MIMLSSYASLPKTKIKAWLLCVLNILIRITFFYLINAIIRKIMQIKFFTDAKLQQ